EDVTLRRDPGQQTAVRPKEQAARARRLGKVKAIAGCARRRIDDDDAGLFALLPVRQPASVGTVDEGADLVRLDGYAGAKRGVGEFPRAKTVEHSRRQQAVRT